MASTVFQTSGQWDASARYTDSGVGESIRFSNHNELRRLYFTLTADDNLPAIPITDGSFVRPGETDAMTLKAGERIWFAHSGDPSKCTVEV